MFSKPPMLFKVASVLLIILIPSTLFGADCMQSQIQGENDAATTHSTAGGLNGWSFHA